MQPLVGIGKDFSMPITRNKRYNRGKGRSGSGW